MVVSHIISPEQQKSLRVSRYFRLFLARKYLEIRTAIGTRVFGHQSLAVNVSHWLLCFSFKASTTCLIKIYRVAGVHAVYRNRIKWSLRKIEKKPNAVFFLFWPQQNDFVPRQGAQTNGRQTRNFTSRNGIVMGYKS